MFKLTAIFIWVQTYCREINYTRVRETSDNITAISDLQVIKKESNQCFLMKLQKNYKYGVGVPHKICGYQLHTFQEHKILRLTGFLETSVKLLSGNKALKCLETQH